MSHHYLLFDHVTYRYPDGGIALDGVTFRARHGEKVAIVGANGAGKSTLLLHANGLLLPTSGRVVVGDVPVVRQTLPIVRRTVGVVFQNPDDQLFMPTVEEDVAFGPANMGLPTGEIERRVVAALAEVGASALRRHTVYGLSGGQKRSVAIAGVLAMEPSLLMLDEPTSNLDPRCRRLLIERLARLDHTCVIATHDIAMVRELCPRTIVMSCGRVIADGPTDAIFADTALLARASLL